MNLGLFKELCCFFLFWAIFSKMAWSPAYKASFRSFSFKLLPSKKLPFFSSWKFFSFFPHNVFSFQNIFWNDLFFSTNRHNFSHSTLSANLFSCNCLWVCYGPFQFQKEISSDCRAFPRQWAHVDKSLPTRLIAELFFGDSSCEEFHLLMVLEGSWENYAWH